MSESGVTFKNLGSFRNTLKEYVRHSKRNLPTILNTKGFYIARGSARETPKTGASKIDHELGAIGQELRTNKQGKLVAGKKIFVQAFGSSGASRAALIVNARRGRKGQPGLEGNKMYQAILKLLAARKRSSAFIKSGWLESIKQLEPYAEKKSLAPKINPRELKRYGRAKGYARPAVDSWTPRTIIVNSASPDRDKKGALELYGLPAFEKAWISEIQSMRQYIIDKMTKTAKDHGLHK